MGIRGFPKLFGGSHNKDHSILGSILGSPYFGKLPDTAFVFLARFLFLDMFALGIVLFSF